MSDRRQAILAQLKVLIEARKAAIRVRIIDKAFAQFTAACVLVAFCGSTEARTISKPIGFYVRSGGRTTVVLYPNQPVRQTVIYQTNVIQPTCRPAAQKAPRATYKPSKYTPPIN